MEAAAKVAQPQSQDNSAQMRRLNTHQGHAAVGVEPVCDLQTGRSTADDNYMDVLAEAGAVSPEKHDMRVQERRELYSEGRATHNFEERAKGRALEALAEDLCSTRSTFSVFPAAFRPSPTPCSNETG